MRLHRTIIFITLSALVVASMLWSAGSADVLLRYAQGHLAEWQGWLAAYPVAGRIGYFFLFSLIIGLYLPGGVLLMLLSGACFSFGEGVVVASLSNLAGAVIGMLLARRCCHNWVRERFPNEAARVNRGIAAHGAFYLFLLRLAPVVPSPVVNLVMGMTDMRLATYAAVTLLGRIPMTVLYVALGSRFMTLESVSGLLSLEVAGLISAVLLVMALGHLALRRMALRQKKVT